jgi:hypothetical protein
MNLKALAILSVGMFALSSAFAGDKACCAGMAGNDMKGACSATFANLNLSSEQKTKMEKLAAECDKGGCNSQTMAKMEKGARKVLNKEQFAAWKAACNGMMSHKTQS